MIEHQGPITDSELQALVDGEFDMATHARLLDKVKKNPALLTRLEEIFNQKFMLKEWWRSKPLA